jgi:Ankyrin repeats (3 copies)
MRRLFLYNKFRWAWGIFFFLCNSGCSGPQPIAGNYSGQFVWQDGLKEVSLALQPEGRRNLDLRNDEVRREIEAIVQEQVKRANIRVARGRLLVSILGASPFLISLKRLEIQEPDLDELRLLVEKRNIEGIQEFVGHYHNVNQRSLLNQSTALFDAAVDSDEKVVQSLLSLGADPNIADDTGDTALMFAILANHGEIVHQLILAGADVNHADLAGRTPLIQSVEMGRLVLVNLLLNSGADPNYTTQHGESALSIARDTGNQAVIAALLHSGASK